MNILDWKWTNYVKQEKLVCIFYKLYENLMFFSLLTSNCCLEYFIAKSTIVTLKVHTNIEEL